MSSASANKDRRFARETGPARAIADLAEPVLEELGFRLVRVKVSGRDGGTVQIMAERPSGEMSVEDCATISRRLSPVLDAYDPMPGQYRLEVSSPGIDRPLTRLKDYADWAGHQARVSLAEPLGGRKQVSGTLKGIEGETVTLLGKNGEDFALPFANISSAKLLLTDKLINATAPLSTEGADAIQTVEE